MYLFLSVIFDFVCVCVCVCVCVFWDSEVVITFMDIVITFMDNEKEEYMQKREQFGVK